MRKEHEAVKRLTNVHDERLIYKLEFLSKTTNFYSSQNSVPVPVHSSSKQNQYITYVFKTFIITVSPYSLCYTSFRIYIWGKQKSLYINSVAFSPEANYTN
jgi:hypothetical protein